MEEQALECLNDARNPDSIWDSSNSYCPFIKISLYVSGKVYRWLYIRK